MNNPLVSVLMPVYNGANDLQKALDSILNQTFSDFEVIAINDGSTDTSAQILDEITDQRVRVVHQENIGLAATLNKGLSLAVAPLIARQDQDDISHPERLLKQVNYMNDHPECSLLGTAAEIWVGDEPSDRAHIHPTRHAILAFELMFNNPFVHSSIMMRRHDVLAIGGYSVDRARQPPEDYELWSRMARHYHVANLTDKLLIYREVPQSMSRAEPNPFLDKLVTISAENLAFANDLHEPDSVTTDIAALTHSAYHRLSPKPDINAMEAVIEKATETYSDGSREINDRARERLRVLQYQWALQRSKTQWLRPFLKRIHSLAKILNTKSR